MMKAADVVLAAYETIGAGLCTAIIRGSVANVAMALDVGMMEAERLGELHAVMMVPRPLEDLDQTLPLASCWIEQPEPLRMPMTAKQTEKEVLELPEAQTSSQPLALSIGDREVLETPVERTEIERTEIVPRSPLKEDSDSID
jgi:carbon dioxide concentrating mechanism protein CcmO